VVGGVLLAMGWASVVLVGGQWGHFCRYKTITRVLRFAAVFSWCLHCEIEKLEMFAWCC